MTCCTCPGCCIPACSRTVCRLPARQGRRDSTCAKVLICQHFIPQFATSEVDYQARETPSTHCIMSASGSIATCSSTVLSSLLTNQYISQCSTDSGYVFTAASVPTQDVIDLMCASSACRGLLADAQAMDLSECILPVGDNIRLLADLIDYIPPRCPSASGSAATASTTTDSTVAASSTAGNDTASAADTITAPSTASSTTSSGETSTTATSAPATESSGSAASASASAASASSGSSAASPVGRALSVMSLGALAVVTYFL
ncbi:hypothetical protein PPTG_17779 [Phytophthora nicotianae INRA-310]|uniref:Elicitin n=2 Tax=Phytophthora nicotianae TaxID=4792 RepID=W2PKY3_PHYN3|nr:hypothetical protein PPTG_17779 [Phytophthora nicotianae INRA-310]ETN00894.1 hypothetical protein PPTG_17779 [Phytophthora nicotianae INRA-310]